MPLTRAQLHEIHKKVVELEKKGVNPFDCLDNIKPQEDFTSPDFKVTDEMIINAYANSIIAYKNDYLSQSDACRFLSDFYKLSAAMTNRLLEKHEEIENIDSIGDFGQIKKIDFDEINRGILGNKKKVQKTEEELEEEEEKQKETNDKKIDEEVENAFIDVETKNIVKTALKNIRDLRDRKTYDVAHQIKDLHDASLNQKKVNNVLFDANFFNDEILGEINANDMEAMIDADSSKLKTPIYDQCKNKLKEANTNEPNEDFDNQVDCAKKRISTYIVLKNRSDNRTFLDILKHPINAFKEWMLLNNTTNELKEKYNFTDSALEKIEGYYLDRQVPDKFAALCNNGEVIKTTDSVDKVNDKMSKSYPIPKGELEKDAVKSLDYLKEDTKSAELNNNNISQIQNNKTAEKTISIGKNN